MKQTMLRVPSFIFLASLVLPRLFAAPTIASVQNAASYNFFNSPIAQGAVFVIKGSGLGPANISVAATPFQNTSLSGSSVAVTVGSTTVNAPMYYTSDGQVAALLPSNTPAGTGNFTVTYNGQTSAPVGHGVAAGSFGILTLDSSGQGPAIVTYPDYTLVSAAKASNCGAPQTACGAANSGDTLIIWGTGLGPVSGDDASGAGLGQNMPNIPLTVWLGGVKAPVTYQGRSGCCVGEDEIYITVPDNAPTGCAVPLVVQIGTNANTISNTAVLPVAKGSRSCTPTNPALASVDVEQAVMAGPVSYASVDLNKRLMGNGYQDIGHFQFYRFLGYNPGTQPFFSSFVDDPPQGTCIVYNSLNPHPNLPITGLGNLDAGASFTVKGPNGSMQVAGQAGEFRATLSAAGTFLVPGAYTVTGNGGADIGSFTASLNLPMPATLTSPKSAQGLTVTRASGMTVNWSGGDPNAVVQIFLESATDQSMTVGATVQCNVAANAGTFTVPSYVLLRLPAGNFSGFEFAPAMAVAPFTVKGAAVGIIDTNHDGTAFGGFPLN